MMHTRFIARISLRSFLFGLLMFVAAGVTQLGLAQEEIVLTFRQNDPPDQTQGVLEAIEEWNATHPNIRVNVENVPWSDALNQYLREAQAGSGPDVLQTAFVWTRDLASAGLVMNLDDFISASPPGAGIDDFLGVDLGEFNGGVHGIPWSVDTFVFGYRPDLFEEAGIDSFPDTWDELFEAASQLTHDRSGDGRTDQYGLCFTAGGGSNSGMWFLANYHLWSNGHFFVEPADDGSWSLGLTAAEVTETMNYFNQFFEAGYTPETMIGVSSWSEPDYVGALGRGDCAIIFVPPASFEAAMDASDAPLRTAAIPEGSETRISHLGGRHLVINSNTQHPEAAWEFLTYLNTQDFYENHYSNYFPPQQTLLNAIEFPEALQGYAEQLPHAITFNQYIISPAPVSGMWAATNRAFSSVYSGQNTAEQAADNLLREITDLLD